MKDGGKEAGSGAVVYLSIGTHLFLALQFFCLLLANLLDATC
jgi:hypothetical protein